jgi:hypothetical protein
MAPIVTPPVSPPPVAAPAVVPPAAAPPTFEGAPPVEPPPPPAPLPPVAAPVRPTSASPADGAAPKRHVNPFLANDPNAKARRLARALVSDMIAYLPQKREEGLRDGTLKQIFREEIKKSYEEYVDQIGKEFAESTNHFADALNDILAGGQRMF